MKSARQLILQLVLLIALVPLVWIAVEKVGWLGPLEYLTVDWRFKARGELENDVKLIYVDMDSEALELMGERPIPRSFFANTVDALYQYGGVRVVGIDALFSEAAHSVLVDEEKVLKDTAIFREVVGKHPSVVLATAYTQQEDHLTLTDKKKLADFPYLHRGYTNPDDNTVPELPEMGLIGLSFNNLGLINVADHYSPGAIPRWVPMFAKTIGPVYYTFALEVIRNFYRLPKDSLVIEEDELYIKNRMGEVLHEVPLEASQLVEINWFSPWISEQNVRYSMKTVLAAQAWIEQGSDEQRMQAEAFFQGFKDAIILIGPTDPLLHDLSPTPFDATPVPRVSVHGNLIKTILADEFLVRMDFWGMVLTTYLLTLVVAGMGAYPTTHSLIFKGVSVIVLLGYIGVVFYMFGEWDWVMPLLMPVGSAVSTGFAALLIQLIQTERQRAQIKSMFGTYVSPDLVDEMVEKEQQPRLGGEEKEITALFSDIASFTSISEELTPSALIDVMNEYLSEMTDVIQEEKGTLDKYIGDAIVSMFGAPMDLKNHALAACRAVCKMQVRQKELRERWKSEGSKWTERVKTMETRIGLNTGRATIGNMGSEVRFNYTMLGDTVNLGARCEAIGKMYGVSSIASEYTKKSADSGGEIHFRLLDKVIVKGKSEPVELYEIIGMRESMQTLPKHVEVFHEGMEHYFRQNWAQAIEAFQESLKGESGEVNPSKLFIDRCESLRQQNLPEDWDGVFVLKSKTGD